MASGHVRPESESVGTVVTANDASERTFPSTDRHECFLSSSTKDLYCRCLRVDSLDRLLSSQKADLITYPLKSVTCLTRIQEVQSIQLARHSLRSVSTSVLSVLITWVRTLQGLSRNSDQVILNFKGYQYLFSLRPSDSKPPDTLYQSEDTSSLCWAFVSQCQSLIISVSSSRFNNVSRSSCSWTCRFDFMTGRESLNPAAISLLIILFWISDALFCFSSIASSVGLNKASSMTGWKPGRGRPSMRCACFASD